MPQHTRPHIGLLGQRRLVVRALVLKRTLVQVRAVVLSLQPQLAWLDKVVMLGRQSC